MKILIIEDESAIRNMVRFAFTQSNYHLLEAENCKQAEKIIFNHAPQLILLDWMLPGISGIEFARQLKSNSNTCHIPIIMLTAKAEEESKIKGLETGADDYITKPFSPRELLARIKTVLRRGPLLTPEGTIQLETLCLNINTHEVYVKEEKLALTPINYQLLYFFIKHQDRVYTREQLLLHIWPGKLDLDDRIVDVQIRRLRNVLKPYGYDKWVQTVRASGYKFSSKI